MIKLWNIAICLFQKVQVVVFWFLKVQVVFFWFLILELPLWNVFGTHKIWVSYFVSFKGGWQMCGCSVCWCSLLETLLRFELSFFPCMHIKAFTFIQRCYK